jgi:hypothetical protein
MRLRRLDWFLVGVAVVAAVAGLLLDGQICHIASHIASTPRPGITALPGDIDPCASSFPVAILGLMLAVIALSIVAIRMRRWSA